MSSSDSNNWRARSSSPPAPSNSRARSSSPTTSSSWRSPSCSPSSANYDNNNNNNKLYPSHFGAEVRPGSMIYLPLSAKEACLGKQVLVDEAFNHPVLVTKINADSVEILQCTSFGGRGHNAWEIKNHEWIHIDPGCYGSDYRIEELHKVNLSGHVIKSVLEKSTFASRQVYKFRLDAFNKLKLGGKFDIPQLDPVLFDHVVKQVYVEATASAPTPKSSIDSLITTADIQKARKRKRPAIFGPSTIFNKKICTKPCTWAHMLAEQAC